MEINTRYVNCISHNSSEGQLLIGDTHTALIDCGMAFCVEDTMQIVKNALIDRPLDYIFATHTHYDHIGSLPFFRKEWPEVRLVTSEVGAEVLLKDTPRRVIRELSTTAAEDYGNKALHVYSDDAFQADVIVKDGDIISLGDLSVKVIETPGHTRDSLSYLIPELGLLISNETQGVLLTDGNIYPCYLTSFNDAANSIDKCRAIPHEYLSLPHRGIVSEKDAAGFFDRAKEVIIACRDFILNIYNRNLDEKEMLDLFYNEYYSETLSTFQPKEAFFANARATINCTLRDCVNL